MPIQLEEIDQCLDLAALLGFFSPRSSAVKSAGPGTAAKRLMPADQEVLDDGKMREQFGMLKRTPHSKSPHRAQRLTGNTMAIEQNIAGLGTVNPVYAVEHRGLAGAIRSDNCDKLGRLGLERHGPQRLNAAEREHDIVDFEFGAFRVHPHHRRLRAY